MRRRGFLLRTITGVARPWGRSRFLRNTRRRTSATTPGDDTITLGPRRCSSTMGWSASATSRRQRSTASGKRSARCRACRSPARSTGAGTYSGMFNVLPDRGYNLGGLFTRITQRGSSRCRLAFTPYTGSADIGGATVPSKSRRRTNHSPRPASAACASRTSIRTAARLSFTTGLDPDVGYATLFGKTMPYVTSYTGVPSPSSREEDDLYRHQQTASRFRSADPQDPTVPVMWVMNTASYVYYFDSGKQIVGAIVPPAAFVPHALRERSELQLGQQFLLKRSSQQPGLRGRLVKPRSHTAVRFAANRDGARRDAATIKSAGIRACLSIT